MMSLRPRLSFRLLNLLLATTVISLQLQIVPLHAADTTAPSAPGQPTEGTTRGVDYDYDTDARYTIFWPSASDPESGIVAYELQERAGLTGSWTTRMSGQNVTSWSISLLLSIRRDKTKFFYQVRAKNGAGLWGPFSPVSDGILVDKTPPKAVSLTDVGATWPAPNALHARWTRSSDPESGLQDYQYMIRQDSPTGSIIVNLTSAGLGTEIARTGLNLVNGKTYYVGVRARNNASLYSPTNYSNGILFVPPPVLLDPPRPPLDLGFSIQWTDDPRDYIYQLAENPQPDFSTPGTAQYWPRVNRESIPPKPPGTYYYRVRSWTHLPENGGAVSPWSNAITVRVFSDEEFLDMLERKIFDYLIASTFPNGLTLDRMSIDGAYPPMVSIAANGFYLSALTIGAERGWMDRTEALNRAKTTLETFNSRATNVHGFFYHFLKTDGSRFATNVEVSSMDTALLIAGALQAGEYFGGEVKDLADLIYKRVEWDWMLDPTLNLMRQGWKPESGFLPYHYGSYSEALLLYLLAIGSPTHPISRHSFYTFARPKGSYDGPDFIFTPGGQIFTYQYPHAWYDFRNTRDELGVNWWENSVQGVRANQRFAIDNPSYGYSQFLWGLTSSDGPNGYKGYGAKPSYENIHDGTIAPTGAGGSIALTEDIALPSLKHLYVTWGDQIWRTYGFVDAFNPSNPNSIWVDRDYLGIDQGNILMMLENRRNQLIWNNFMKNEHVLRSLSEAGFSGYTTRNPPTVLEDFEDGNFWTPETSLGWWDVNGRLIYQRSRSKDPSRSGLVAMKVAFTKQAGFPWSYFAGNIAVSNALKDFSQHTRLVIWVFGPAELLVKLEDRSVPEPKQVELGTQITANPNGWNRLVFDYSGVNSVDLADIQNIFFFADPGNPSSSGTFYVDDLTFE